MAGLTMTKIRAFAAGAVALLLVVVLAAVVARMFHLHLPVLDTIAARLGF